jgi:feruloyl esterase
MTIAGLLFLTASTLSCDSLRTATLPNANATITFTQMIEAGPFDPPAAVGASNRPQTLTDLPFFCRVSATLRPTSDSDIKIEVWLPILKQEEAAGWNGKFQAVGNGGWSGAINYTAMAQAIRRGYATSSTDTGHAGGSGAFALGHPEKLIDFAWRSEHEMTIAAKALIAAFYGTPAKHSYWVGCSAGGRQGLKEAQKFPQDYDGIVAGAPANDWTGRAAQSLRVGQAVRKEAESYIPPAKYRVIHDAVLQACDALDGVKDGLIANPVRCRFDPGVLECKSAAGNGTTSDGAAAAAADACLTRPQVAAARAVYETKLTKTDREIRGLQPGSELGWGTWAGPNPFGIGVDHFRYVVFKNPAWDAKTFNFDEDIERADEIDHDTINALDPDLQPFFNRGGKMIQYHGWNDPQIAPGASVDYYTRVLSALGGHEKVDPSYRLFMVPGMAHCGGGEGPNTFNMVAALEQWVEKGQPPAQIIATHLTTEGRIDRTRPLCPYPQVAECTGTGSTDDAANFVCRWPTPSPR